MTDTFSRETVRFPLYFTRHNHIFSFHLYSHSHRAAIMADFFVYLIAASFHTFCYCHCNNKSARRMSCNAGNTGLLQAL